MATLASYWLRHFRLLWNSWTESSLCFFGAVLKKQMVLLASDWLIHFNFSSEIAERNSTKLDKKQDLDILYHVCIFPADNKNQDGRPGLWLAETFSTSPLKPLNGIQRYLTGSKISTSTTKLCFSGGSERKDGCPVQFVNKRDTLYSGARYTLYFTQSESFNRKRYNKITKESERCFIQDGSNVSVSVGVKKYKLILLLKQHRERTEGHSR